MEPDTTIYLTGLEISEGCFSGERAVTGKDFYGEEFSGFFENNYIKDGNLEVQVLDSDETLGIAKVKPVGGGYFFEIRDVNVHLDDLKYC